jgi:hypothetical protein
MRMPLFHARGSPGPAQPAAPERSSGAPVENAAARAFVAAVNSDSSEELKDRPPDDCAEGLVD